ncbi:hypothetical protein GIB67_015313 [Kingdonia uniflora]|uniref:Uncharacterized protein n=1 Tax=Kingdonia uniflora TaxID=39325 RepID=A0A7J7KYL2_9MAGN|nr:hypothetical protein GIB67_015313 [Kingdonia uniflora]
MIGEELETSASYWAEVGHLLTDSQRMGNIDLFGPTVLRTGITPVVVTSASVHSLSQDFSLFGEVEGPDPGRHMEWTGRREMLPIVRLRDPPPMSSSYGAEELWYLTHGMRRLALVKFMQDAQRLQELTDEFATAHRHIDSIDHQLYAHDLQLRRGRDVRVVPGRGRVDLVYKPGEAVLAVGGGVLEMILSRYRNKDLAVKRILRGVLFTAKSLISKTYIFFPFYISPFINLFTIWYYTLLSTLQPQMSSSSSDLSIADPLGVSSSSSSDDLIFDCAAAICVLHLAAMNIVVHDTTLSHNESVMSHKDKRKRDHPLRHYNIIRDNFKPNCTYEP